MQKMNIEHRTSNIECLMGKDKVWWLFRLIQNPPLPPRAAGQAPGDFNSPLRKRGRGGFSCFAGARHGQEGLI